MRVLRDAINAVCPAPVVVSEGANTMDNARIMLEPVTGPRLRLDAGTWGTMGVGLGYAMAAAVADPGRLVVAVEGDSAFGFSGMELETLVRCGCCGIHSIDGVYIDRKHYKYRKCMYRFIPAACCENTTTML